jgi:hypothetical protein
MAMLGAIVNYMLSSPSLSVMVMMLPMPNVYMLAIILQK